MHEELLNSFLQTRNKTESICAPLEVEDYVIQSMDDVSPPKWHLAHTSWFFETFLLQKFNQGYEPFHPDYNFLFNSYYETIGRRWDRPFRGLLSRPTVKEVYAYRSAVTSRMGELIQSVSPDDWKSFSFLVTLGINHEQQHQELLLTDIKHILSLNPVEAIYSPRKAEAQHGRQFGAGFLRITGGIIETGYNGNGFSFDNELPRHQSLIGNFRMGTRLITNREYLEFMQDGGYGDFRHWLSDGWQTVQTHGWNSPMYWRKKDDQWHNFTLSGWLPVDLDEPVCHVSHYEADAFARWSGKRLPTEPEWEHAANSKEVGAYGMFMDDARFQPATAQSQDQHQLNQMFGDVWEWTTSAYLAYPGFKPGPGALGEYNAKFMSNQMVLRGGSCATPRNHIRASYRNFFQPDKRWQFMGIRLADDDR